jgi:predicted transcriptional regulator
MDDGAQKWKNKSLGVRFCTDNFSLSEVNTLIHVLQEKYKLKCSKQKKQNNFRIYISSQSYTNLHSLIFHFFIPSMTYKWDIV